jgi:hypothetical protein
LRSPTLVLVGAAVLAGVFAYALQLPRDLPFKRSDIDDLRRLLDTVRLMRAREILEQPKKLEETDWS